MKFKTLETCALAGTMLEGQTECLAAPKYYESRDGSERRPRYRVLISRGSKRVIAKGAEELAERLRRITPALRSFAEAHPGAICAMIAHLENRGRPICDHPLWRDFPSPLLEPLEDYFPSLEGDLLIWHHLDVDLDRGRTSVAGNRFNVVTGRFERAEAAVA